MAFSIKDEQVDKDVRYLAQLTGESLTGAVAQAVRERIARMEQNSAEVKERRHRELMAFLENRPRLPELSQEEHKRLADELWGE